MANDLSINEKILQVETNLLPAIIVKGHPTHRGSLDHQMKSYGVPAVSIAVINEGQIEWAKAYGIIESRTNLLANIATLFQAGSVSKPIAAFGALTLVQNRLLNLDEDVNKKLSSWKIPETVFTNLNSITLRQLLNHTSGFNVIGFDGYKQGDLIPSLIAILKGEKPANNAPIQITLKPGEKIAYSGGGYCVMQQLVEDITQLPFSDFMNRTVFQPLEMTHSTMHFPLVDNGNTAHAHPADGNPMIGGSKTYPESAAAGLWSTPTDLAKWLIHIQNSLLDKEKKPLLSQETLKLMMTPEIPPYGLGPVVNGEGKTLDISHKGRTDGFACGFIAYPFLGKGAVVMINSDNGASLVDEILRSIAFIYQWPTYQPKQKISCPPTSEDLVNHIGRYGTESQKNDIYDVIVSEKDGELFIRFGSASIPYKLYKEDDNKFFVIETGFEILFNEFEQVKTLVVIIQEGFERNFTRFV